MAKWRQFGQEGDARRAAKETPRIHEGIRKRYRDVRLWSNE
jgi:hypothetical protein